MPLHTSNMYYKLLYPVHHSIHCLLILLLHTISYTAYTQQANYITYVDTRIGTSNGGNTYPGAVAPWGMVYVNPYTIIKQPNAYQSVNYNNGDSSINAFTHTNISGVGCPTKGSILIMPSNGTPTNVVDSIQSTYTNMVTSPGYFSVQLRKHNIQVQQTVTARTAIHQFTYTQPKPYIVLDLSQSLSTASGAQATIYNRNTIVGYVTDGNFCGSTATHKVYFAVQCASNQVAIQLCSNGTVLQAHTATGSAISAYIIPQCNNNMRTHNITLRVGISYVSTANALLNLAQENAPYTFTQLKHKAKALWQQALSTIHVHDTSTYNKTLLYTALYHTLLHPNIIDDANGQYPIMGNSNGVGTIPKGHHQYSTYSLWDTYRNVHSLLTLLYPAQQLDMVRSMVRMYQHSGALPKWELGAQETYTMVGDPAGTVIAATYLKGLTQFNVQAAYKAMLHHATNTTAYPTLRPSLGKYLQYKYIPNDSCKYDIENFVWGSASTTLEYCIADGSIAALATALGKPHDAQYYNKRSQYFTHLIDSADGFIKPKLANGTWYTPFNPTINTGELSWNPSGGIGYVEGNAWQYRFMANHHIPLLIGKLGGKANFLTALNTCFNINQFVLWNEPDMHYPYLYNYVTSNTDSSTSKVQAAIRTYYNITPSGIPGNDDCGTMSSWLIFSMLGLYPVHTVSTQYAVCIPSFTKVTLRLNGKYYTNKQCTITKQLTKHNKYQLYYHNKHITTNFITHHTIVGHTISD